jgi:hypothetical protein
VCRASVVSAYFVAVGLGDVGSVNGDTEALIEDEDLRPRLRCDREDIVVLEEICRIDRPTCKPTRRDILARRRQ